MLDAGTVLLGPIHLLARLLFTCGTTYMHSRAYALETCKKNTKRYPTVPNMLISKIVTIFITT
jgi:hypothetical protein